MRRVGQRLLRSVLGEVDRQVLPIVPITLIYNAAFSTFWVYVGVFVVKGLRWRPSEVGVLFLASAPPAAVANYLSGRLSDRLGRRRPIVFSFAGAAIDLAALAVLGRHHAPAFALIVLLGVVGAPAYSLDRVLVADLVDEQERREAGYATVRVAGNLGLFAGPPLAGLVIATGGWTSFLIAGAALGVLGAVITAAVLPSARGPITREPAAGGVIRLVLGDRPFSLLLLSTLLGFIVCCGFETVLPIIAVSAYGIAPATWGLLVAISPLLVILLQLRLTRAASRVTPTLRLSSAMLLMGLPFLGLIPTPSVAVIAMVIVAFVLGEMVWAPTSQGIVARLAPPSARGAYFGALAAMTGPAWTLAPFIALQLRARAGVTSVWVLFAIVATLGAAAGVAAIRATGAVAVPRGGERS